MKTFKILFAALIITGFATTAMAQEHIEARAEVMSPIEIEGQEDLNFSLVAQGIAKTVDLEGGVTGGAAQGDETAGRFRVQAASGSHVTWSFSSLPSNLSFTDGEEETVNMPITYTAGWSHVVGGTDMNDLGSIGQGGGAQVYEVMNNEFFVFLGGTVTPGSEQAAGVYTADVTITAEYN